MSEIAELLERFRRGPEVLAATLTGAAGSEVDFQPAPGKWSVRQIIAHVADSEMVVAVRMRQILAEDNPTLQAFDQDLWAQRLDYAKRKPSQSLESFRRVRLESHELLRDLPEALFQRTGNHTERGAITLLECVTYMARHAELHAEQVRRVREAFKLQKNATA